jgi:hypothetical protein
LTHEKYWIDDLLYDRIEVKMLNQNTTTILTTLITVLGTLGGVVLGVVLSNRYVARQEKAKRHTAIIEEVYTLLTNITAGISENVDHERPCLEGKPLQDDIRRLHTLIFLYLPALREKLDVAMKSMFRLAKTVNDQPQRNNLPVVWKNIKESFKDYNEKVNGVKTELEKLVR